MWESGWKGVPCKLLVVDFDLLDGQQEGECGNGEETDHDYSICSGDGTVGMV